MTAEQTRNGNPLASRTLPTVTKAGTRLRIVYDKVYKSWNIGGSPTLGALLLRFEGSAYGRGRGLWVLLDRHGATLGTFRSKKMAALFIWDRA